MTLVFDRELQLRDFAEGCVNALNNVKTNIPKIWHLHLQPYKDAILKYASQNKITNGDAVKNLIAAIHSNNEETPLSKATKIFYMAAYCDMN